MSKREYLYLYFPLPVFYCLLVIIQSIICPKPKTLSLINYLKLSVFVYKNVCACKLVNEE